MPRIKEDELDYALDLPQKESMRDRQTTPAQRRNMSTDDKKSNRRAHLNKEAGEMYHTGPMIDDPVGQSYERADPEDERAIQSRFDSHRPVVKHPTDPHTLIHDPANTWDGPTHVTKVGPGHYKYLNWTRHYRVPGKTDEDRMEHFDHRGRETDEHGSLLNPHRYNEGGHLKPYEEWGESDRNPFEGARKEALQLNFSRASSYSGPGYYVTDKYGAPQDGPYQTYSLAIANLNGRDAIQFMDQAETAPINEPFPPQFNTVMGSKKEAGDAASEGGANSVGRAPCPICGAPHTEAEHKEWFGKKEAASKDLDHLRRHLLEEHAWSPSDFGLFGDSDREVNRYLPGAHGQDHEQTHLQFGHSHEASLQVMATDCEVCRRKVHPVIEQDNSTAYIDSDGRYDDVHDHHRHTASLQVEAISDRRINDAYERHLQWSKENGHDPDTVEALRAHEKARGITRAEADGIADLQYIGGGGSDWRSQKESNVSIQHREAQILDRMARNPHEASALMVELESIRRESRLARQASEETDLANAFIHDVRTPVPTYSHHTAATDWLGQDTSVDPGEVTNRIITSASLWYSKLSPEVKADRDEFLTQAHGYFKREASQFGPMATEAFQMAMSHVDRINQINHTANNETLLPWSAVVPPLPPSMPSGDDMNTNHVPGPGNPGQPMPWSNDAEHAPQPPSPSTTNAMGQAGQVNTFYPNQDATPEPNDDGALQRQGASYATGPYSTPISDPDPFMTRPAPQVAAEQMHTNPAEVASASSRTNLAFWPNADATDEPNDDGADNYGGDYDARAQGGFTARMRRMAEGKSDSDDEVSKMREELEKDKSRHKQRNFPDSRTASGNFNGPKTTYQEYLARISEGATPVSEEFWPGMAAAVSPNDATSRREAGLHPLAAPLRPSPRQAANTFTPEPQNRDDPSGAGIGTNPAAWNGGAQDNQAAYAQSGMAQSGLPNAPQGSMAQNWSNISDFPDTGPTEVNPSDQVMGRYSNRHMAFPFGKKRQAEPAPEADFGPAERATRQRREIEDRSGQERDQIDRDKRNEEGARATKARGISERMRAQGGRPQCNLCGSYGHSEEAHDDDPLYANWTDTRPWGQPSRDDNVWGYPGEGRDIGRPRVAAKDDDDGDDGAGVDRSLYAQSPVGQQNQDNQSYSSDRHINWTGTPQGPPEVSDHAAGGVPTSFLGTVPVQGYAQDAEHPSGEMWPWTENAPGSGAADVASVPTPGIQSQMATGTSWPQPVVNRDR